MRLEDLVRAQGEELYELRIQKVCADGMSIDLERAIAEEFKDDGGFASLRLRRSGLGHSGLESGGSKRCE